MLNIAKQGINGSREREIVWALEAWAMGSFISVGEERGNGVTQATGALRRRVWGKGKEIVGIRFVD